MKPPRIDLTSVDELTSNGNRIPPAPFPALHLPPPPNRTELQASQHAAFSQPEATQQDVFDTDLDDALNFQTNELPAAGQSEPEIVPWARLISKDTSMNNYELMALNPDDKGRFNLYSIGRGSFNSIKFDYSTRISSNHCFIYCKRNLVNPQDPFLEAFIEDVSGNGTFVNDVRLVKGVPRQLHTGDVICLINPMLVTVPSASISSQDVNKCSFVVTLNLPNPLTTTTRTRTRRVNSIRSATQAPTNTSAPSSSSSSTGLELGRSHTVIRLLTQKRSIFDFYEIKQLLGQGGEASVHLGVKKDTGQHWAIKIIDTRKFEFANSSNNNNDQVNAITREAEMLRSLRHPNIILLEDIFQDDHNLYLVMELSHGGDLFERIVEKGRYPEDIAKITMKNILEAIAYMHNLKIAHRDLKPENILLSNRVSDTDVKISDFGVAKVMTEKTALKTYCGTPQYFAPEVLQRKNTVQAKGTYTMAADMWSLGVILYVLLAGTFPFDDPTRQRGANSMKYSFNNAALWSHISAEAKDLIGKLLQKDPSDRLSADQALRHPWFTGQPYDMSTSSSSASCTTSSSTSAATTSESNVSATPTKRTRTKKAAAPTTTTTNNNDDNDTTTAAIVDIATPKKRTRSVNTTSADTAKTATPSKRARTRKNITSLSSTVDTKNATDE